MNRKVITAILALVAMTLGAAHASAQENCHPKVDPDKLQFVVGYGSLMEEASKRRSAPDTGMNHPVLVRGFQRVWNARGNPLGFSTTYLGVDAPAADALERRVADSSAEPEMVAAVYQDLSNAGIEGTDARENIYCRYAVPREKLQFLDGWALPEAAQVWIYALPRGSEGDLPTERWPIVQSYVDIFLTGCLDLEKRVLDPDMGFARKCIETTKGWSRHWVNDRLYPRRAFIYQPNASTIDKLLAATEPTAQLFDLIEIE